MQCEFPARISLHWVCPLSWCHKYNIKYDLISFLPIIFSTRSFRLEMTYMMCTMSFIIFITYAPSKHVKHVTWHDLRKCSSKIHNSKINKSLGFFFRSHKYGRFEIRQHDEKNNRTKKIVQVIRPYRHGLVFSVIRNVWLKLMKVIIWHPSITI